MCSMIDSGEKGYKLPERLFNGVCLLVDVGPLMVVFGSSLPSSIKKKNKKQRCQSLTPSGKTFWIRTKCANSSEPSLRSDL